MNDDFLKQAAAVGVAGALAVLLLDSFFSRVTTINASPTARSVGKLLLGAGAAYAAQRAKLPPAVATGLLAGPLLGVLLDIATGMISTPRLSPPPARSIEQLGQPWGPRLLP